MKPLPNILGYKSILIYNFKTVLGYKQKRGLYNHGLWEL